MKRGISSLSFSGPLEKKIEAAAQAGFDGIEIFREDLVYCDDTALAIGRYVAESGIEIFSLQSLRDFEALPEAERAWNFKRAGRFLDLAASIGAPLLVVCANTSADTIDDADLAAADLARLADMAAERGLRVGYEALAVSRAVRTYAQAWEIIKKADRPNLGLVFGAVHAFAAGSDFGSLETMDPQRIFLVHLADAPLMKMDVRLLSRHFRLFPGQGELPIPDLYKLLRRLGYDGPISLEIFNDQVRAMSPSKIANDGIRSFHLLEEITGAETTPHPVVQDIGFIELTCHGADGDDLKRLLKAMGFACTHRHKSKNVFLYRQGAINLVLNEETEGLAHSFYLMHGLAVCGLGLTIDKLPAMLDRISMFHGGEVMHLAHPGELDIPTIRGLGGSLIFCLDGSANAPAFSDVDFEAVSDPVANPGDALVSVDHFSQAVAPTEFLSSLLFYRAMFGFESDEQRDVTDPHGTVRNRTLSNNNGRIQFSLNSSIGPSTMTQRFLSKNVLASYQHFAFYCADIFSYAANLDQKLVLRIPSSYYDNLPLVYDLEDELIEKMRALNVLYDQDGDGHSYFQIYMRDINGLFFEVVQRDGYTGFGAANAPVRAAAQARDFEEVQELLA